MEKSKYGSGSAPSRRAQRRTAASGADSRGASTVPKPSNGASVGQKAGGGASVKSSTAWMDETPKKDIRWFLKRVFTALSTPVTLQLRLYPIVACIVVVFFASILLAFSHHHQYHAHEHSSVNHVNSATPLDQVREVSPIAQMLGDDRPGDQQPQQPHDGSAATMSTHGSPSDSSTGASAINAVISENIARNARIGSADENTGSVAAGGDEKSVTDGAGAKGHGESQAENGGGGLSETRSVADPGSGDAAAVGASGGSDEKKDESEVKSDGSSVAGGAAEGRSTAPEVGSDSHGAGEVGVAESSVNSDTGAGEGSASANIAASGDSGAEVNSNAGESAETRAQETKSQVETAGGEAVNHVTTESHLEAPAQPQQEEPKHSIESSESTLSSSSSLSSSSEAAPAAAAADTHTEAAISSIHAQAPHASIGSTGMLGRSKSQTAAAPPKPPPEILTKEDDGFDEYKFYGHRGDHLQPDRVMFRSFFSKPEPLRNGVFVEVGAVDGVDRSNTAFYEETLAWSGLLIEPQPDNFMKLQNTIATRRAKSTGVQLAVCAGEGESADASTIKMVGDGGSAASVDFMKPDQVEKWSSHWKPSNIEPFEVKCAPMRRILADHSINHIDILSIDLNGAEVAAVQTFPFDTIKPKIIVVDLLSAPKLRKQIVRGVLRDAGYCIIAKIGANRYFTPSDGPFGDMCPDKAVVSD